MNWSLWIRQFHRWVSIIFTAIVLAIFVMLGLGHQPVERVYYLPLPPLFLLMFSGLYMFFRPSFRTRGCAAGWSAIGRCTLSHAEPGTRSDARRVGQGCCRTG